MSSSTPSRHTLRRASLRGTPRLSGDQLTQAQVDRLMQRIVETPTGCWLWQAGTNGKGYGIVVWLARCYRVHKLMLEWATGRPIPDGYDVDHLCKRRDCVNPAHLEAVTHAENIRRIRARDARPLFDWRSAKDYRLNLAHLDSIEGEL